MGGLKMVRQDRDYSTPITDRSLHTGLRPGECPIADRRAKYDIERALTAAAQYLRYQFANYQRQRKALDFTDADLQDRIVFWFCERAFSDTQGWANWSDGPQADDPPDELDKDDPRRALWDGIERMVKAGAQSLRHQLGAFGQTYPEVNTNDPAVQDWIVLRTTQRIFPETKGWLNWEEAD